MASKQIKAATDEAVERVRIAHAGCRDASLCDAISLLARIDDDAERIADLERKGADLCQFAGTMMLMARRVLGIDRFPHRPETGMDSFSPDAKVLYDLITHPSAAGYAEAITARDDRIAELERVTGPIMACGCYAVEMYENRLVHGVFCCDRHNTNARPTPEYLAWKESR